MLRAFMIYGQTFPFAFIRDMMAAARSWRRVCCARPTRDAQEFDHWLSRILAARILITRNFQRKRQCTGVGVKAPCTMCAIRAGADPYVARLASLAASCSTLSVWAASGRFF